MPLRGAAGQKQVLERSIEDWANPRRLSAQQALQVATILDKETPRRSGNLRNQWQVAERLNNQHERRAGASRDALGRIRAFLARYERSKRSTGANLYIFNNTPYAAVVERRRGFMRKALARIR